MPQPKIKKLPGVSKFKGLSFNPGNMMVTAQYKSSRRPAELCEIQFPLAESWQLTGWLCEMLDKLSDSTEWKDRLEKTHLRGAAPKGHA